MLACRPRGPAITLQGQASTTPGDREFRTPHRDLVANPPEHVDDLRSAHACFVETLAGAAGDERVFAGRGVVVVGGGEHFGPAIVGIHMLRRTGSTLPVEVFLPDDAEYEAGVCEDYLPKLDARCVVLSRILERGASELAIARYRLKAAALLLSSFAEVVLLDSDSIPLLDPELALLETIPYHGRGLIVWPDFWRATESPRFWDVAGLSGHPAGLPTTSSGSGQLVANKKTHLATLLLAAYYNVFGVDHYYPLLSQGSPGQGDKETFMAAAVVLNSTYYRVQTAVSSIGRHDGSGYYEGAGTVQYLPCDEVVAVDRQGDEKPAVRAAFLHSDAPKMNAGRLVDGRDLVAADGRSRLRLLGSKVDQEQAFGFDLESTIWELLEQTGCELAGVIREWKGRVRLCEKLQRHRRVLFGAGESRTAAGEAAGTAATAAVATSSSAAAPRVSE